jgi:2'-5' RNA ligase
MRAFFCLELEPQLQRELDQITQALRKTRLRASWVRPENLHVTLIFLGEIRGEMTAKLEAAGREALTESDPPAAITWELDRLGAFPSLERPRVVWVGSSREPDAIPRLVSHLQARLRPLGFAAERGGFVTHVTLARVKETGPAVRALTHALQSVQPFQYQAQTSGLTLMESQLSPQGSAYRPIFRLPFST